MIKSVARALLVVLGSLAFPACEWKEPDRWAQILVPQEETELLCPTSMPWRDCVIARWQAYRMGFRGLGPQRETALKLCELGACEPGNIYDGPWLSACFELFIHDFSEYNYIVLDPCKCPRGVLLDANKYDYLLERGPGRRPERDFDEHTLWQIEEAQSRRGCAKPEPGPDRILATEGLSL